ncbi:hypothetical protein M426DRAFT_267234 [Hypoxylon sp. CI-4A]|nr:hypothetical protein M426DRAFT_267234 [Hypoxylon sp. CI-4A]
MCTRACLSAKFLRTVGLFLLVSTRVTSHSQIASAVGQCPLDIPAELQPQTQFGCAHAVDDSTSHHHINWSPWTHLPECVQAQNSASTKFCVFSNSRHGNGGISLITTPETAANSAELLNDSGYTHFKTFINSTAEPPYEVIDMPGKGKGTIATRHIKRAEVIMADWAALIVNLDFPTSVRRTLGYEYLHVAADQLSDPDRVLQLGRSNPFAADIMEDVLRTNAFSWPLVGDPHMALYPDVSRINHACRPNAFIRFTPTSYAVSVIALRDIEPGEEISITYVPLGKTREERQEALKKWGFTCTCSLCTASKAEVAASDYLRTKIKAMREEVMKAVERKDGGKAVKLTREVLELMRAEELAPLYASQYEIIARLYWIAGDRKTGTEYARMSVDTLVDQGYLENSTSLLEATLKTFDG